MKLLGVLLGVVFGAAEFGLTKAITDRATSGKAPVVWLVVKIVSYAAVLLPVVFRAPRDLALWSGVGAGAGLLIVTLVFFICKTVGKRGV